MLFRYINEYYTTTVYFPQIYIAIRTSGFRVGWRVRKMDPTSSLQGPKNI